jgi:hypothetical protein
MHLGTALNISKAHLKAGVCVKMAALSDEQVAEYFHRSYQAVDGLWFMKVEEKYGFDTALQMDKEVWKVMPKIQARMIKAMLKIDMGEAALRKSLETKLALEGFKFKVEQGENGFRIRVSDCPWHNLIVKSGREKFAGKVGTTICGVEYSVWASEFDEKVKFRLSAQKCEGSEHCILEFRNKR